MIPFAKTEAFGNDFLIVSEEYATDAPSALAIAMCDRLRGIGADGLILYRRKNGCFVMTLFNSDGSFAEISGNGLRCLAAYLTHAGLATGSEIEVETGAGLLKLSALGREGTTFRFRADMGPARGIDTGVEIVIGERTIVVTTLSMGNPHCVVFAEHEALRELGPALESHPHFPDRTNVELVEVVDRHTIRMAIWERGAGETASSGTGSSASAVASIVNSYVESPVEVHCPGGRLEVEWTKGESVFLTGDAVVVAEGDYWRQS
ncbi:MAG: diaminopimelate epimerase [Acidobacteriota bacterium]|nr:MAG: diaminopimelate epimerase [Acidobacteriota bacterium]